MEYTSKYKSPLGDILLAADDEGLTGLWFVGQKYFALGLDKGSREEELPVFHEVKKWLDIYFSGKRPDFMPDLHFVGTEFQNEVWEIMCTIPYGKTMTYGEIAGIIARKREKKTMYAQAVGSAVGHNRISVIVPCHRVIGSNGNLTGYAGGIDKKIKLLEMEGALKDEFFVPKTSKAP